MEYGEPKARHGRHSCLKFGWCDGAYQLPDGRVLSREQFDAERPPSTANRYDGVTFAGVMITDAGREAIKNY